ncbi:phosphatidylcholine/phosphatidylserine synthase [bacterium]|nr:phosphatidylcholine/phosphatidylserine synthase [bacterium]
MLKGNPKILIPNFFTGMNMFIGLVSIFYSISGDYINAAWLVLLSAVLDKLDGTTARLFNASSDFGVEFDSFSDFVSFSLAPAVLVFSYFSKEFPGGKILEYPYFVAVVPLYVIFCAVRLARYNSFQSDDHDYFSGLTSTQSGGMLAAYMVFAIENPSFKFLLSTDIVAGMMLIQACLMLLPFKYPKVKMPKNKIAKILFILYFIFLCGLIFMRRLPWLLWISGVLFVLIGFLVTRKISISISNTNDFNPEEKQEEQN